MLAHLGTSRGWAGGRAAALFPASSGLAGWDNVEPAAASHPACVSSNTSPKLFSLVQSHGTWLNLELKWVFNLVFLVRTCVLFVWVLL